MSSDTPQHSHLPDTQPVTSEEIDFFSPKKESLLARVYGLGRKIGRIASADTVDSQIAPLIKINMELQGDVDDSFVRSLADLRTHLGIKSDANVIYPGSSTHVGAARVFGRDHVVHVDPDLAAITALRKGGYKGEASRIEEYKPLDAGAFDVMVALNSYGTPTADTLRRLVKPGGLIIANNYTAWAQEIQNSRQAELIGAVLPSYTNPEARYVTGAELEGTTSITTKTYKMSRDGRSIPLDDPAEGVMFDNEEPAYPDGLFVFQMPGEPSLIHEQY